MNTNQLECSRAGCCMVAAGLEHCLNDADSRNAAAAAQLEKLYLALG